MRVDAFDFDLPREAIAARPAVPRDRARLLHVAGDGLHDRHVTDLPGLLRPGDLLVFNDTRVIPARLDGRRGDTPVEVTLVRRDEDGCWSALARPARKLRPGDRIDFARGSGGDFAAEVLGREEGGGVRLRFALDGDAFRAALERHGVVPLPPYIPREAGPDSRDATDYQTIFARHDGAIAAPTAALHFTDALCAALDAQGIASTRVTLHVGPGTFLPVKVENTDEHRMHAEYGRIDRDAAETINRTVDAGGRVIAVGTTTLRLMESAAAGGGRVRPFDGETDIFITPGYRFRVVDGLLTNFHLPRSTLFMLVCAFAGLEPMRAAYEHAKAAGYRFYSYGDCCLLRRSTA